MKWTFGSVYVSLSLKIHLHFGLNFSEKCAIPKFFMCTYLELTMEKLEKEKCAPKFCGGNSFTQPCALFRIISFPFHIAQKSENRACFTEVYLCRARWWFWSVLILEYLFFTFESWLKNYILLNIIEIIPSNGHVRDDCIIFLGCAHFASRWNTVWFC